MDDFSRDSEKTLRVVRSFVVLRRPFGGIMFFTAVKREACLGFRNILW